LAAVLATSCSLGGPAEASSIDLNLEVDNATLHTDEFMTITLTARNVGYDPLTLAGPSGCLLYVEVLSSQGSVVWSNGSCAGSTVTEEIAAGEVKIQSFTWDGSGLAGARLASGPYRIRGVARVTGAKYIGPPLSIAIE
jgi:hypothetical protein